MDKNVGGYDRALRSVVGPVLLAVGLATLGGVLVLASGPLGVALAVVLLLVGAILTVTAATQKCPLNRALGADTYRHRETTETTETTDETSGRPS